MNYELFKQLLSIDSKKISDEYAYITHYLQNAQNGVGEIYSEKALQFISDRIKNLKEVKWGIPFPPPKNPKFKFIDLFAGIGGFRLALQDQGGKCVFSSEIDNSAKQTYEANFGEFPFGDIRDFSGKDIKDEQLDKLIPDHDVLTGGFPCQPFSLAGVSARKFLGQAHGFSDKDSGNLFFDIARIVEVKQPKVVFLENVRNFKGHDRGNTFSTVRMTMEDLGYKFFNDVINSQTVVPQRRVRFYIVCFKTDDDVKFEFPELQGLPRQLGSILEENVPIDYTISDRLWEGHKNRTKRNLKRGTGFTAFVADLNKPAKTLVSRYGKDGKECLIPQANGNPRKLTPRECARLQGFPEEYILPSSDAAAYRQFGNSVAVPVIKAIAKKAIKVMNEKL